MHLAWRLATGSFCVSLLSVARAGAQPAAVPPATETLETPYEEPPPGPPPAAAPVVPPPAPVPPVVAPASATPPSRDAQPDTRPLGPIRSRRRLALTGELGWNGLAGFGPVLTYHAHPHVSFDLGGGVSLFGWKAGVRGRYNFMKSPFTPFVGLGFNATTGLGEVTMDPADDPNAEDPERDPVTLDLKPSYLVQGTLGFDFIHRRGFTMIGCIGYAWLLNEDNVEVLAGKLKADEEQAVDFFFTGGAVISLAFGYAFE
jgi:hypothetical protein